MTDEQYPFDYEPTQGTTFKDMYPGNDYSGMIAGRNASDALPAAKDYTSTQPSFWDKLNTRSVATNPASTPLVGALNGLANIFPSARPAVAANQQMWNAQSQQAQQQQAIDLHKKQVDQQAVQHGFELVQKGMAISDPTLRNAYYTSLKPLLSQFTGEKNPLLLDVLMKTDAEQQPVLLQGMKDAFKTMGIDASPDMIQSAMRDPKLRAELFSHISAHQKLTQEKEQADKLRETLQKALGGATDSQIDQSITPTPAQPQTAPGGSQGPSMGQGRQTSQPEFLLSPEGQKVQQFVVSYAQSKGLDPANVQALIHQESGWDPTATSPTGVVGLAQVTNATGNRYGQTDTTRTNPYVSAKAGIDYLADLTKQNGGDFWKAVGQYNGGSDPNYVQNVQRHVPLYGDRPTSPVVSAGGPEYQKQLSQLNGTIQRLESARNALLGDTSSGGKVASENLNKKLDDLRKDRDTLEKKFETPVPGDLDAYSKAMPGGLPFNQRTQPERERIQAQFEKEKQARTLETSTNQGLAAADRAILPEAHLYLDENKKPARITTNGQLLKEQDRRALAGEPPLVKWDPLKPDNQIYTKTESQASGIKGIQRIMKYLDDPETAKLVGSFMSNPEASVEKTLANVFGKSIPDKYREVAAEISHVTSGIIHDAIGGAQTPTEYARLKPLIGSMNDPNPTSVKSKMTILHNAMTEDYNTRLTGFDANQVLAPRTWKPFTRIPTALDRQATAPTAPPPEADPKPGASQLPEAPKPTASGKRPKTNAARDYINEK